MDLGLPGRMPLIVIYLQFLPSLISAVKYSIKMGGWWNYGSREDSFPQALRIIPRTIVWGEPLVSETSIFASFLGPWLWNCPNDSMLIFEQSKISALPTPDLKGLILLTMVSLGCPPGSICEYAGEKGTGGCALFHFSRSHETAKWQKQQPEMLEIIAV